MSPKRKKVETALKNLFSNKNAAETETSVSSEPVKLEENKQPEKPVETKSVSEKPKPRRAPKTTAVKNTEKTEVEKKEVVVDELKAALPIKPEPQPETSAPKKEETPLISQPESLSKPSQPASDKKPAVQEPTTPVKQDVSEVQVPKIEKTSSEADKKVAQEEIQLVVFELDHEYFGVEIALVESIIKMQHYTVVPHTPDYLVGVTNLRGYVLPVVDLRRRFDLPDQSETADTRIMVLMLNGEKVGMIVDGVSEVARVFAEDIDPTPKLVTNIHMDFINGIAKLRAEDGKDVRMAILLNMEKVLKTK